VLPFPVIDIKPGSDGNRVNICSKGVLPVAILSYETFDATDIDPTTVDLEGAGVKLVGKDEQPVTQTRDVNKDGIKDLVVHIETADLGLASSDPEAELIGKTFDGIMIVGKDAIDITQFMCLRSLE